MSDGTTRPIVRPRSVAVTELLEFTWPGLGHAHAGRRRQPLVLAVPPALLVGLVIVVAAIDPAAFASTCSRRPWHWWSSAVRALSLRVFGKYSRHD